MISIQSGKWVEILNFRSPGKSLVLHLSCDNLLITILIMEMNLTGGGSLSGKDAD